jgi:hypothetical protein
VAATAARDRPHPFRRGSALHPDLRIVIRPGGTLVCVIERELVPRGVFMSFFERRSLGFVDTSFGAIEGLDGFPGLRHSDLLLFRLLETTH